MLFIVMAFFGFFAFECFRRGWNTPATILSGIVVFLFLTWLLARKCASDSKIFMEWLTNRYTEIKEAPASYQGKQITLDTQVVQYFLCVSLLTGSVKIGSGYMLRDNPLSMAVSGAFTIGSLLLGWWGLPHGPIWTIECVINNLSGATKKSIGTLIYDIETEINKKALQGDRGV